MMRDGADDTFAPGRLEVGVLTTAEYDGIMGEGSQVVNDPLYDRDESCVGGDTCEC